MEAYEAALNPHQPQLDRGQRTVEEIRGISARIRSATFHRKNLRAPSRTPAALLYFVLHGRLPVDGAQAELEPPPGRI